VPSHWYNGVPPADEMVAINLRCHTNPAHRLLRVHLPTHSGHTSVPSVVEYDVPAIGNQAVMLEHVDGDVFLHCLLCVRHVMVPMGAVKQQLAEMWEPHGLASVDMQL
jgi:hypothetical protein